MSCWFWVAVGKAREFDFDSAEKLIAQGKRTALEVGGASSEEYCNAVRLESWIAKRRGTRAPEPIPLTEVSRVYDTARELGTSPRTPLALELELAEDALESAPETVAQIVRRTESAIASLDPRDSLVRASRFLRTCLQPTASIEELYALIDEFPAMNRAYRANTLAKALERAQRSIDALKLLRRQIRHTRTLYGSSHANMRTLRSEYARIEAASTR